MSLPTPRISKRIFGAGLATLLIALSSLVQAQTPKEQLESLVIAYQNGDGDEAFKRFFAVGPATPSNLSVTIAQIKAYVQRGGSFSTQELVLEKEVAPYVKLVVFMSKQPLFPVVWSAYFYQGTPDKWWPIHINVSGNPLEWQGYLR